MLTLFMADANKPLSLELYSRSILKIYPQKEHKVTQGHWRYRPEFSKLSSLIIKFMRMTAVLMVTWNPEGRVMEGSDQLITKMWVLWALPSSRVCCWSVISGSRASTSSSHFVLRQFFSHDTKIKLKNSNKQNLSLNPCSTVSNWKSFCFYNCVIYFPLFIFFYVTSVLFISVFKSVCNASWS